MTRTERLFVFSLALAPLGAGSEEIVTVSSRPGATQSYLLLHDAPPPAAVAVLFPGGEGLLGLRVENLGRTYPLITVMGGKPAESDPCEPFAAHGYFGKDPETVAAIRNWMLGQPFPKTVE
jgi:hypothetical protein